MCLERSKLRKQIFEYIKTHDPCTTTQIVDKFTNKYTDLPTWVILTVLDELLDEKKVK